MFRMAEAVAAFWALAGGVILVAIMLITSVNVGAFGLDVLARLVGANVSGLPGYEDFVSLAISCAAMMFLPYCQLKRGHVVVDLFANLFPKAVQRGLDKLWLFTVLCMCIFLAYWMYVGMLETRSDGVLTPILGWTVWPTYIAGIASLILWGAIAALLLFREDRGDA